MRKIVFSVMLMALLGIGCGGGGESVSSDNSNGILPDEVTDTINENQQDQIAELKENNQLPEIVDDYSDGLFKYVDQSLYVGQYVYYAQAGDDCVAMFGANLLTSKSIVLADSYEAVVRWGSSDVVFNAVSDEDVEGYDMWGYEEYIDNNYCGVATSSASDEKTIDMFGVGCVGPNGEVCIITYVRDSAFDFTSVSIKSTFSGNTDVIENFMNQIHKTLK